MWKIIMVQWQLPGVLPGKFCQSWWNRSLPNQIEIIKLHNMLRQCNHIAGSGRKETTRVAHFGQGVSGGEGHTELYICFCSAAYAGPRCVVTQLWAEVWPSPIDGRCRNRMTPPYCIWVRSCGLPIPLTNTCGFCWWFLDQECIGQD